MIVCPQCGKVYAEKIAACLAEHSRKFCRSGGMFVKRKCGCGAVVAKVFSDSGEPSDTETFFAEKG